MELGKDVTVGGICATQNGSLQGKENGELKVYYIYSKPNSTSEREPSFVPVKQSTLLVHLRSSLENSFYRPQLSLYILK